MTAKEINKLFRSKGLTLASVESFTGGQFACEMTSVSGASHFFKGGMVTYFTEEKVRLLGIPYSVVDQFGVVSKEVAYHMANAGKKLMNVDYCVSFTGNAGPSAMENKPVGEIYIGIAFGTTVQVHAYMLKGTREEIRRQAIDEAYKILEALIK